MRDENTDADGTCDDDRKYHLDDANFNVTTLVDTAGDAVERYVCSPYGTLTNCDATWSSIRSNSGYAVEYTHTSRRLDPETGLYYYRHRVMSPQLGRFLSRDPVGYADANSLYAYVRSLPTSAQDPAGLQTLEDVGDYPSSWIYVGVQTGTQVFRPWYDRNIWEISPREPPPHRVVCKYRCPLTLSRQYSVSADNDGGMRKYCWYKGGNIKCRFTEGDCGCPATHEETYPQVFSRTFDYVYWSLPCPKYEVITVPMYVHD